MSSRLLILGLFLTAALTSCDNTRIYETSVELPNQVWVYDSLLLFDFEIDNKKQPYNLLANIQYANDYTYRNLYMTWVLYDSMEAELDKSLINTSLFSDKLGKPLGSSAIGDIYELQAPILEQYQFPHRGKYRISLQQYMRVDSLHNISRMGLRVERSITNQ